MAELTSVLDGIASSPQKLIKVVNYLQRDGRYTTPSPSISQVPPYSGYNPNQHPEPVRRSLPLQPSQSDKRQPITIFDHLQTQTPKRKRSKTSFQQPSLTDGISLEFLIAEAERRKIATVDERNERVMKGNKKVDKLEKAMMRLSVGSGSSVKTSESEVSRSHKSGDNEAEAKQDEEDSDSDDDDDLIIVI